MINTDYNCNYFIDFHEKFANYIYNNSSINEKLIKDIKSDIIFQSMDLIFPKEQINSLYESNGVKNISNNSFLEPIFKRLIDRIIYKIYYFKNLYLIFFVRDSVFHEYFEVIIREGLSIIILKHIRFHHIHKNDFYLDYNYKIILIEFFEKAYTLLNHKVEKDQIIKEVKRLQELSIEYEEFSFLNDIIMLLRQVKAKKTIENKIELNKVQNILNPILENWIDEKESFNFCLFIMGNSIKIKEPFTVKKPAQYFYYLLFILRDFCLITDERIIELVINGKFIHFDGNKIDMDSLSNAKNRYKKFDYSKPDNKKSEGCIRDLKNLKNSLSEIAI